MTFTELKQKILGALQEDLECGTEVATTTAGREFAETYPMLFKALSELSEIEDVDDEPDSV